MTQREQIVLDRARKVGLEAEIEPRTRRYVFSNPKTGCYTHYRTLEKAETFTFGLIWGFPESRP